MTASRQCLSQAILAYLGSSSSGVPNPRATDWYRSVACYEPGRTAGVSGGRASKASSVFIAAPHCSYYRLSSISCQISGALDSHKSVNPTVNCACEGSRLRAPYENLMPDDLRWSWGHDASAGEWLQIQMIISREVWLHRDHNKSIACRLISKPYPWVASEN